MNITIGKAEIKLTPMMREYIEVKIGTLARFIKRFETVRETQVMIEVTQPSRHHRQGNGFSVSAALAFPHKALFVKEFHEDFHAAVDLLKDSLKSRILDFKERAVGDRLRVRDKK
ncbi:MAG: ribosome-associated translation inhibitor RaiA [Patescibacteria group bacterium]